MLLAKADIIPRGEGPGAFSGATPTDTSVRVFADTAVLRGSIKTADSGLIRMTLVCQKPSRRMVDDCSATDASIGSLLDLGVLRSAVFSAALLHFSFFTPF
jgi:hypothetical protein